MQQIHPPKLKTHLRPNLLRGCMVMRTRSFISVSLLYHSHSPEVCQYQFFKALTILNFAAEVKCIYSPQKCMDYLMIWCLKVGRGQTRKEFQTTSKAPWGWEALSYRHHRFRGPPLGPGWVQRQRAGGNPGGNAFGSSDVFRELKTLQWSIWLS